MLQIATSFALFTFVVYKVKTRCDSIYICNYHTEMTTIIIMFITLTTQFLLDLFIMSKFPAAFILLPTTTYIRGSYEKLIMRDIITVKVAQLRFCLQTHFIGYYHNYAKIIIFTALYARRKSFRQYGNQL